MVAIDMAAAPDPRALDAFLDVLYDLLHERAHSVGLLDIGLELNEGHVDGELLFTTSPDMGLSLEVATGTCRYCELVGDDAERWLDVVRDGIAAVGDAAALRESALVVLDGLLAARRPLLTQEA